MNHCKTARTTLDRHEAQIHANLLRSHEGSIGDPNGERNPCFGTVPNTGRCVRRVGSAYEKETTLRGMGICSAGG
jgi:hypothetical protein